MVKGEFIKVYSVWSNLCTLGKMLGTECVLRKVGMFVRCMVENKLKKSIVFTDSCAQQSKWMDQLPP